MFPFGGADYLDFSIFRPAARNVAKYENAPFLMVLSRGRPLTRIGFDIRTLARAQTSRMKRAARAGNALLK